MIKTIFKLMFNYRIYVIISVFSSPLPTYAGEYSESESEHYESPHDAPYEAPQESPHDQVHNEAVLTGGVAQEAPTSWSQSAAEPPQDTPFRGNWFKKRALLQEMRVSQEALHKMVQDVWIPDHKKFQESYSPTTEQMREIQQNLGFSQQTIDEIEQQLSTLSTASAVTTGSNIIPAPSQIMPSASFESAVAINLLKEMRESLQLLDEIRGNTEKALQQAQQQEPLGNEFDQQAWKYYEEIDAAYDDHQAEQLYEQVRASEEYLNKLHEYMLRELSPYINHLVGRYEAVLKHIETVYNALFKQGIILRKADIPPAKPVAPAPVAPPQLTWWQWILSWIMAPFYAIARWVTSLFGMK